MIWKVLKCSECATDITRKLYNKTACHHVPAVRNLQSRRCEKRILKSCSPAQNTKHYFPISYLVLYKRYSNKFVKVA